MKIKLFLLAPSFLLWATHGAAPLALDGTSEGAMDPEVPVGRKDSIPKENLLANATGSGLRGSQHRQLDACEGRCLSSQVCNGGRCFGPIKDLASLPDCWDGSGGWVSFESCNSNGLPKWHVDGVSKKIYEDKGNGEAFCLLATDFADPHASGRFQIHSSYCVSSDPSQEWSYNTQTKQIESLGKPGWCAQQSFNLLSLAPCSNSIWHQRFDVSSFTTAPPTPPPTPSPTPVPTPLPTPSPTPVPKQIKVNGKCLQMLNDYTVVARDCNNWLSLKWDYDDNNKRVVNQKHNRCLEVDTSGSDKYTLKSGVCGNKNKPQKWYQDKNGHIRTYRYEHHCLTHDTTTNKFSVENCHKRGLDTQMFEVPSSFEGTSFFVDHYGWGLIKLKTDPSSSTYQCLAMDYDDPNDPDDQHHPDYRGTNRQVFAKTCDYNDPRQFWTYYPDTHKLRNKKQYHNGDDQCIAIGGDNKIYARTSCGTSSDRYDWWLDENTYLRNGNTPSHWCLHTDSTGVVKLSACPGNAAAFIQIDSRFGLWGHKTLTPSTTLVECPHTTDIVDVLGGVMTVEECKGAGLSLGGVLADGHSVTTGTWARVPCGCFLHGSSKTIHFRTECGSYDTTHPLWLERTLVCRAEVDRTGQ